jgi:hypothetical protein
MHVIRYILLSIAAMIPSAWAAITYYPRTDFTAYTVEAIGLGTFALAVLTIVSVWKEDDLSEQGKTILMSGFLLAILLPSMFVAGAYIQRTTTSWSGGEIHYHADYEVIVQGEGGEYEQLDLIDPSRFCQETRHESTYMCELNDRTGATEYHEHDDRRIHLEGTFWEREDATLSAFFETFGGELSNDRLVYPTNDRVYNITDTADDNRTLKIAIRRSVGGDRHWCTLGANVSEEDLCRSFDTNEPARSPSEYVVTNIQQGPIDVIWIVYDSESLEDMMADVREDDQYKQFQIEKTSEGY